MIPKVAVVVFFVAVFGLLIGRRLVVAPQEPVIVVASQNSDYAEGDQLRRGEMIETSAEEFVLLKVGDEFFLGIDARSRVELSRLFLDERILKFSRGRIEVTSFSYLPVFIETNKTMSSLEEGRGIFINYDFQQLVTIAPVVGSIQTQIKGKKDYLLTPVALNIHEAEPVTFSKTVVDPTQGSSAPFHSWFEEMINR